MRKENPSKEMNLEKDEIIVLGLENIEKMEIGYYSKLFESYSFPVSSVRLLYKGVITNLAVIFKKQIKECEKKINLPGFGEFEITKSIERMKEFSKEKEFDNSFPFAK